MNCADIPATRTPVSYDLPEAPKDQPLIRPGDLENVFAVLLIGWIFAAVTLVCLGSFNPIRFLVSVGTATVVVTLSLSLSLLTAVMLRNFSYLWKPKAVASPRANSAQSAH